MSGLETLLLKLCASVVKSTTKVWLGDAKIAADATAAAIDVLVDRVPGLLEKRRLRRVFDRMEDVVATRLEPLVETEYGSLAENEKLVAIEAARQTFDRAALTDEDLFAADLDAGYVYRYLVRTVPDMPRVYSLSADATAFYDRLMRECSAYLVQITTTLPRFQTGVLTELLRRDTEIVNLIHDVLTRMPERRGLTDFEADYRLQIVTALDRVSFFGATLSEPSRQYPLSVAYISLAVSARSSTVHRIEELLPAEPRLFIRGEAGSGKTTLLQWIAVRCVTRDVRSVDLGTPFLIRLRRYADAPLPTPEHFLDDVSRHIADEMPDGWVHQKLRSGHAIVLVDGVDELPEGRREEAKEWLRTLIATFPDAQYVVTSRPAAVALEWLDNLDFTSAELQPLTPSDVRALVQNWHDAMRSRTTDNTERAELDTYQKQLIDAITSRRALRRIAETPLLCALLCALHRDRHGHLPANRMELYEITLHMLLERRDKERGIISGPAGLGRIEKTLLLQDVAYWLVRNGLSDAPTDRVRERLAVKLKHMPQVGADMDTVFRHLLERTGLLREPVVGRIDFVHRTFQEYLAAKAAIDADDIGVLVRNAHLDQWFEVVVMAAGHAPSQRRDELLAGILRGRRDSDRRSLVALACLETSPELSDAIRDKIHERVKPLLPPQTPGAANALAAGGDRMLDLVLRSPSPSEDEILGTIWVASAIGGDDAMHVIARFSTDRRPDVVAALMDAWLRFDPVDYARFVLADSPLRNGAVTISDPALIPGLPYLTNMRKLYVNFFVEHSDLSFVSEFPQLVELHVINTAVRDLTPLTDLPQLKVLELVEQGSVGLPGLRYLTGLTDLELALVGGLRDLTPLTFLAHPQRLALRGCVGLRDLGELARWADSLTDLSFIDCELLSLRSMPALPKLERLSLAGSIVPDLLPIRFLPGMRELVLSGSNHQVDLTPLVGLTDLKVIVDDSQKVIRPGDFGGHLIVRSTRSGQGPRIARRRP